MIIEATLEISDQTIEAELELVQVASDGGYDRGYEEGEQAGYTTGYTKGHEDGYAEGSASAGEAFVAGKELGRQQGYDEGKTDGEQSALDAFNCNLQGTGIEYAESVDEIEGKFEEATQQQYDKGIEIGRIEGKQAEYDAFWDAYQQNGNRTDYANAFSGRGWTKETFKPKYDIIVTNTYMLFRYCGIKDLGEALKSAGVRLVIQQNQLSLTFNSTLLEVIDGVEFTTTFTSISQAFNYNSYLREIRVPIPVMETTGVDGFNNCNALEEVRFIGTIGKALDVHWSKNLSNASVQNIIDCLQDLTGTTAQKLTLNTAVVANMTETQKTAVSAKNWTLVSSN